MKHESADLLTIGDAARRLGVTSRTLKYYEELELVTPARSEGRYRLYHEADMEKFARILRLRSLGFSLQAIAEMLKRPVEELSNGTKGYSPNTLKQLANSINEQIATLDARIAAVSKELREARALRAELGDDLDYLQGRIAGESADKLIPQRMAARKQRTAGGLRGKSK